MPKIHPRRRILLAWGGFFVLVLLVAGYYTWLAVSVHSELKTAQDQASVLKHGLTDGDAAVASRALEKFADATEDARSHTHSFGWRALGWLPVVGRNTKAVATVADVAVDVAAHALRPAVDETRGSLLHDLQPKDGRVDLAAVDKVRPTLDRIDKALASAVHRIDAVDSADLWGVVRRPFDDLQGQLNQAQSGANAAARAAKLMPAVLGGSGPRKYLVMFDNNAEIRSTGGLPGAWAIIRANHGKISLQQQGSAEQFGEFPKPVLPQSAAEHKIFDRQIATYFADTNFTPEFPRTAALAQAMYQRKFGGTVDGVMSIDAVTLSYLLRATGPVSVGGVELTADNAVDQLLNKSYTRLRKPAQQDVFFAAVAKTVFDKVSSGAGAPTRLASALGQAVDEGRVYLNLQHPDEQAELAGTEIAGELGLTTTTHPEIGVYINDATGSKMSYFLRSSVHVQSLRCDSGQQAIAGYVDLHMVKPRPGQLTSYITGGGRYGTPAGQQLDLVYIYGPVGGTLSDFRMNGDIVRPDVVTDRGRQVATTVVQLKAGQAIRLRWSVLTAKGQAGSVLTSTTPDVGSAPSRTTSASSCS